MKDKLKELLFTALGQASMCWQPKPSHQVFDSTEATKIGNELTEKVLKVLVEQAMEIVCQEIKLDPGYRISWQANIAMAFKDEMERSSIKSTNGNEHFILVTKPLLHDIANTAADNFLDILCRDVNKTEI